MNEETRNYIRQWISKANDDLIVIDKLTQNGIIAPSSICFHYQQIGEKYLIVPGTIWIYEFIKFLI